MHYNYRMFGPRSGASNYPLALGKQQKQLFRLDTTKITGMCTYRPIMNPIHF